MKRYILAIIVILVLGLVGYGVYVVYHAPNNQRLESIEVKVRADEGAPIFMDSEDVQREMAQLGLNYKGLLIDSIDVGSVERKLRKNPLFKDVEVYITAFSRKMVVEVTQQQALFLVHTGGRSYYVTAERGVIPLNPRYAIYLPIVSGDVSESYACSTLYDFFQVLDADEYFRNYFGQVYVDKEQGIILMPRIGRTPLILGHSTAWADMLHKYKIFAQQVLSHVGDDAYEYVKLSYKNQIVARPRGWEQKQDSLIKQ